MTGGRPSQDEAQRPAGWIYHFLIRCGACVGIVMLLVRWVLYLTLPAFMPSKGWAPHSTYAKWAGIAVSSVTETILIFVLIVLPFFLHIAFRIRRGEATRFPLAIDAAFSASLYGAAYFLLAPPR